ncbi:response regulator [Cochleicola gelatinilyticus]|uniref:Response regulatory domain-containing protein n=1 Tax=Cochleicola gelatinilyticus TaxID=1763537 RepID=A0A167EY56_9FLAO|nr:response regulator [Cochleicola gelatinilyticus]OAB75997.1 hypothetical protein ULVI_13105 [Cochleicola gelatinilyticus]
MNKVKSVCIIDDDKIFIYTLKHLLGKMDFCEDFILYHNGLEAVKGLTARMENQDQVPDIILLDLNMPIMDGWEFLKEVSSNSELKKIKTFIVTSSIDPEDFKRTKDHSNVEGYITKPLNSKKLKEVFNHL